MEDHQRGGPLIENTAVRQRPGEGFRRWFLNDYFELILWYDHQGGQIQGLQLCVSRNHRERAFTWTKEYSSSHYVAQGHDEKGMSNLATGILKGDGKGFGAKDVERFIRDGRSLDPEIVSLVVEKLTQHNLLHPEEPTDPLLDSSPGTYQ